MTESALIQDFAIMTAMAGLAAILFSKFKFPKVIGYILVGILINGHTWGGSFLVDETSVRTIGQLGIVFLMFTLGLEFSASDMKKLKNVTFPTAIIDTVIMTYLGYTVGTKILGWGPMASLFLGAAICDSSTTLLAKIIDEMKWSNRPFAKYVVGTSVCEDMICVGIIALISGFASGNVSALAVATSFGSLMIFFCATIVFGLILIPKLLDSVAKRHDDEALLLTLLGCCFFVTWIAFRLDFSLALGAFLVGILGASCDVRHRLNTLASPLRSFFAAVFFVSIGLLVDPGALWENFSVIIGVSLLVIVGKSINCFVGGIISGESIKTSTQMGMSLAQIGEFAYMVALLYFTATSDENTPIFQIVVGVSLLTTILNPMMIRLSDRFGDVLECRCPGRVQAVISAYRGLLDRFRDGSAESGKKIIRTGLGELAVIAILELTVSIVCSMLHRYDWSRFSAGFERYDKYFFWLAANLFFVAMMVSAVSVAKKLGGAIADALGSGEERKWQLALSNVLRSAVFLIVLAMFIVWTLFLNLPLAPKSMFAITVLAIAMIIAGVVGWKFFEKAGKRAYRRFEEAVNADERRAKMPKVEIFALPENTVHKLTLTSDSPAVGMTVVSLNIRAKTGATVVSVIRGGITTRNIGADFEFAIGDTLVALGDHAQIAGLKDILGIR